MEGINLRELVERLERELKNGQYEGYRCVVEATMDHEECPPDPLTDLIRKGALGIAREFWYWSGEWWQIAVTVDWEKNNGCNYIETYRKWNKVRKPIKEIRFLREAGPEDQAPEKNPLLVKYYKMSNSGTIDPAPSVPSLQNQHYAPPLPSPQTGQASTS